METRRINEGRNHEIKGKQGQKENHINEESGKSKEFYEQRENEDNIYVKYD